MIISLTGFMGAGKSTAGAALAARLGWEFTDLDSYVEHKAAKSVERIFREDGEWVFRALEAEAVRDRIIMSEVQGFDLVLALGGGTLGIDSVRPYILEHSFCVYLAASQSTLLSRLASAPPGSRPLLSNGPGPLLEEREPVYRLAGATIATDGKSVQETVDEILAAAAL